MSNGVPPKEIKRIYCCGCESKVDAELTDGREIYRHRPDLHSLPFWKCPGCRNYVGCHHKTKERTKPLGVIPTVEIRNARRHIHNKFDPIWRSKKMSRDEVYRRLSREMGMNEFHAADIKTISEARGVYRAVMRIRAELGLDPIA